MNYLFWNANRKKVNSWIKELIIEHDCDIMGIAEYDDDVKELLRELSKAGHNMIAVPQVGCNRIRIICKDSVGQVKPGPENKYYTIKEIYHNTLGTHVVVFVHLPSKLYKGVLDRGEELRYLKNDIRCMENNKVIVVGDFNANPFEEELIAAFSLHSLSARNVVSKRTRIVQDRSYEMYYNPMWNLFGDKTGSPGTYYYYAATQLNYYWNIFDQVIVSADVMNTFDLDKLHIINEVAGKLMVDTNGIPNISDHLPIIFTIN